MPVNKQIQLRRDTTTNWNSVDPILTSGEVGLDTTVGELKIGDGSTRWSALSYYKDLSGYSPTSHNHNLNDLTEKSYNSLTDKPIIPSTAGLLDETAHDTLDHTGLTGIPAAYSLPTASTSVLGGVKVDGTTVTITDGVISSSATGGTEILQQDAEPSIPSAGDLWIDTDATFSGSSAIDWAAPISVTGATTLTIGKYHVCSGTSTDYTVTLPAVSGNAGKLISVEMSGALTKLVTLDGNASEAIDGATTRVMWTRESAILLCDGTQWTKVGGKSIPMVGYITGNSPSQLFAEKVQTKMLLNTYVGCSHLDDVANNQIIIPRPSTYTVGGLVLYNYTNTTAGSSYAIIRLDGVNIVGTTTFTYRAASLVSCASTTITMDIASGVLSLYANFTLGSFTGSVFYGISKLSLCEVPTW